LNKPFQRNNNFRGKKDLHKINNFISAADVRVILDDGEQLGVMKKNEAIDIAKGRGMDLVEIAPNNNPPVCKIVDYGKFKYQEQKKKNEAKKKVAEDADAYLLARSKQLEKLTLSSSFKPLLVAPFDAELFGHWWYEGPFFIKNILMNTGILWVSETMFTILDLPIFLPILKSIKNLLKIIFSNLYVKIQYRQTSFYNWHCRNFYF